MQRVDFLLMIGYLRERKLLSGQNVLDRKKVDAQLSMKAK